jgi:CTP synthase (UTP-ammonia lyase)
LKGFDALWIAPGSPYKSLIGALNAIRFAREHDLPLLATCGGCQHVVIEYARNVLGFEDAAHAEYDPYASNLFITPLSCSLVGQKMEVEIEPGSRVEAIYGGTSAFEQYYCNFGLNPEVQDRLHAAGLRIVGRDANGEARILTLPQHRFFVATLFVPQLTSSLDDPHPMIRAFFKTAAGFVR